MLFSLPNFDELQLRVSNLLDHDEVLVRGNDTVELYVRLPGGRALGLGEYTRDKMLQILSDVKQPLDVAELLHLIRPVKTIPRRVVRTMS